MNYFLRGLAFLLVLPLCLIFYIFWFPIWLTVNTMFLFIAISGYAFTGYWHFCYIPFLIPPSSFLGESDEYIW